jgi:glycosyltransferase involved in cell wall biosynthesis
MRIAFITTVPESLSYFLSQQVRTLAAQGYEVHTISSPGIDQFTANGELQSIHHEVKMRRTMRPAEDVLSLYRLWRLIRRIRPEILHTHTAKAGFLGMIAASLAGVPIRIYTINGLAIRTQGSWSRLVLRITEWMACALATEVVCVSRSVRRFVIGSRFCTSEKCQMLGDGGSHGVDIKKFDPVVYGVASRIAVRKRYGIPENALVVGYIGRIVPAKGINELAVAWNMLREKFPELRLLLCGYCERDHPMNPTFLEKLRSDPRVHFTRDRVAHMPPVYAALDIIVLPTHCEGLPNVVLEAGAMRIPAVATRVPGCVDAIRNRRTGLIVEPKDPEALAEALQYMVENSQCRERMGIAAREFVTRRFSEDRISGLLVQEYQRLLAIHCGSESKGTPLTVPAACAEANAETAVPSAGSADDNLPAYRQTA